MKDEFFEKILNAVENRPFSTAVTSDGEDFETIAQISESQDGRLKVTLQTDADLPMGPDSAEATMTLPAFSPFGFFAIANDFNGLDSGRGIRLLRGDLPTTPLGSGESERVIDGRSISLTDPVRAKTLTLWYEGIRAEGWDTNSDKQAISITHGGFSATVIPPHGAAEFFIEVAKPELGKNPIEWHISDTHQGIVIRTDEERPLIKIEISPADDRDISWDEYTARIEVERGDFEIEDVTLHIWRIDEAEMGLTEITSLEENVNHSLSFMNSTWCQAKVAIAWRETWSDSRWRGTWTPVWGAWKATRPTKPNRHKNWMPMEAKAERMLEQILRNIREDQHPILGRYLHSAKAMDNGDWASSVTASVAILQRIASRTGWRGVAKHLRTIGVDRPYHFMGWGEEAERLLEEGEPHDHLVKAITDLRNLVTAHWVNDPPEDATWLAQQALYYVESALRAELAPKVPMWDRTRAFHRPPITGLDDQAES